MVGMEADLHRFTVATLKQARAGTLYFHVPNGLGRSAVTASKLKNMGARNGAPDFVIVVGGKANFLELKKPGGKLSPDQERFRADAMFCGARYIVADNENEVTEYLKAIGAL